MFSEDEKFHVVNWKTNFVSRSKHYPIGLFLSTAFLFVCLFVRCWFDFHSVASWWKLQFQFKCFLLIGRCHIRKWLQAVARAAWQQKERKILVRILKCHVAWKWTASSSSSQRCVWKTSRTVWFSSIVRAGEKKGRDRHAKEGGGLKRERVGVTSWRVI